MVAHLAHELRQPLSTMEAIAFFLQMTAAEDPQTAAQIEKLQQLIGHASWILSDAVHFTQATPPRFEPQDLNEAILTVVDRVAVAEADRLEFDLAEDLPLVRADASQLEHLLAGAIHFCLRTARAAEPVAITTASGPGRACLEIRSHAPGLSTADLARIFEPFHPHPAAGSGLGLASVRRIVEVHGGEYHVEAPGDGLLRLTLALPLALDAPA